MSPAFAKFVEPARVRPQLWRLFLGAVLAALIYLVVTLVLIAAAGLWSAERADPWMRAALMAEGRSPVAVLTLLATFAGMALGPVVVVRLLHRRSAATLFGRAPRVVRDFATAAQATGALFGALLLFGAFVSDWEAGLAPGRWLGFLPLALLGILLQTGAEEMLFRGYFQQQLAARFASPFAWAVLPATLFGLAHVDLATHGHYGWLLGLAAGAFGLAAADLTARTGSLGAAWGMHFAINCLGILFVAADERLYGLALFRDPDALRDPSGLVFVVLVDMAAIAVTWWVVRRLTDLR